MPHFIYQKGLMKKFGILLFSLILCSVLNAQEDYSAKKGQFTDPRDGAIYNWVRLGDQVWFTRNLAYISSAFPPDDLSATAKRYYVYGYEGKSQTEAIGLPVYTDYGVLYNWVAAKSACPQDWQLPTNEDWVKMMAYVGGAMLAKNLKSTWGWEEKDGGGTNHTGFSALPGGITDRSGFLSLGEEGYWWSASSTKEGTAWRWNMSSSNDVLTGDYMKVSYGASVRCIRRVGK